MAYYTGIGSRQTPAAILDMMTKLASFLARDGWTLRSGGADGADTAFHLGVLHYVLATDGVKYPADVYIPWNGFNGHQEGDDFITCANKLSNWPEAEKIAARVHPAWDMCSRGAKALHARNTYQVLGDNLNQPSKFLVCWAPVDTKGVPKGGTRTAWVLAEENGVECFNLFHESVQQRITRWLEGL